MDLLDTCNGTIDPNPITIQKSGQLKDLESITRNKNGDLYLLSSQSHSRKGKRSVERTQFLKVSKEANRYNLVANQSLAQARSILLHPRSSTHLGFPAVPATLEIEAMTYWKDALYLGLKTPIGPEGRAIIWKLEAPTPS